MIYREALRGFRRFLTGHIDDPETVGIHGIRSEGFIVCSNAVGEEAAVIQGGWRGLVSASRYDRLTRSVQMSMASDMVKWCRPASDEPNPDEAADAAPPSGGAGSSGTLGIVARRAAAKSSQPSSRRRARGGGPQPSPPSAAVPNRATPHFQIGPCPISKSGHAPASVRPRAALPPGWRRVWHTTSGKQGGYASYVGPNGRHARSIAQAQSMAHVPAPARATSAPSGV